MNKAIELLTQTETVLRSLLKWRHQETGSTDAVGSEWVAIENVLAEIQLFMRPQQDQPIAAEMEIAATEPAAKPVTITAENRTELDDFGVTAKVAMVNLMTKMPPNAHHAPLLETLHAVAEVFGAFYAAQAPSAFEACVMRARIRIGPYLLMTEENLQQKRAELISAALETYGPGAAPQIVIPGGKFKH